MLGIIGYGNVGKLLSKILKNLNIDHKIYDPYLGIGNINDIKDCEVVSIHASSSKTGKFPSHELINSDFLDGASAKVIINSARGEIIDEDSILNSDILYLSDVFKGEPSPNTELISKCFIATPHIAGYSIQAKHNGTIMILKNFCETKDLDNDLMDLSKVMEIKNLQPLEDDYISNGYPVSFFKNLIDVEQISIDFKESFLKKDIPFNNIRNNYELRNDFLGIKRTSETNKLSLFSNLYKNKIPVYEMASGASIAFAALLLIIPGFITDFFGFLLLFPFTRRKIINLFLRKKRRPINEKKDYIDGEILDKEKKDKL